MPPDSYAATMGEIKGTWKPEEDDALRRCAAPAAPLGLQSGQTGPFSARPRRRARSPRPTLHGREPTRHPRPRRTPPPPLASQGR
jgi:hypothetical protein